MKSASLRKSIMWLSAILIAFTLGGVSYTLRPAQNETSAGKLVVREVPVAKPPADFFAASLAAEPLWRGIMQAYSIASSLYVRERFQQITQPGHFIYVPGARGNLERTYVTSGGKASWGDAAVGVSGLIFGLIAEADERAQVARYYEIGPGSLRISPDSARVAYGAARGKKKVLVVDGAEGKEYDRVVAGSLFSPDGKRFAYAAKRGDKWLVVVDGMGGKEYDEIVQEPVFSPEGVRLAYSAKRGGKWVTVVDGVEQKEYRGIRGYTEAVRRAQEDEKARKYYERAEFNVQVQYPIFSPDGKRLAYAARSGFTKMVVVTDGVEGSQQTFVQGAPVFSPDSRRVAYAASADIKVGRTFMVGMWTGKVYAKHAVIVDGIPGKEYDEIGRDGPVFSPGSKRVAYTAKSDRKWRLVVDGVEEGMYDEIEGVTFSPDSKRITYRARRGTDWFLVLDGVERGEGGPAVFSSDGRRVAYAAKQLLKWRVVVDGTEGNEYDEIGTLGFSPDSKRVVYAAKRGNQWRVMVEGVEGTEYDEIGPIAFSPDGNRLAYSAMRGNRWVAVADGLESETYDSVSPPVFDGPTSLHAVALRNQEFLRVEMKIPQY